MAVTDPEKLNNYEPFSPEGTYYIFLYEEVMITYFTHEEVKK